MAVSVQRPALILADRWRDYQLIDCGDGMKQERWGEFTLVRPDPQIIWPRHGPVGQAATPWGGRWHFTSWREIPPPSHCSGAGS